MSIYIYGAGKNGQMIVEMLKKDYDNNLSVKSFLDNSKQGDIGGVLIKRIDEVDVTVATVIIALYDFKEATKVFLELKERGCNAIWWFKIPKKVFGRDFFEEQCISCTKWQENMFEHIEMHIMDACNLNCRGCTHFSPIFEKTIPDLQSRLNDLKLICNKGVHIVQFNILGGEPFLNPEIDKFIVEARKLLPYTEIVIVSNGLLIPNLENKILHSIKENNVKISISEYEPTHKIIDRICKRLDDFSVIYDIRPFDTKGNFNKPLRLDNTSSSNKLLCISDGCINVWNGKIARCPTLMFIEEFNKKFGTNLPTYGVMELSECPEGRELIDELEKTVPLCSHCIENKMEWGTCGKEVRVEDFAI